MRRPGHRRWRRIRWRKSAPATTLAARTMPAAPRRLIVGPSLVCAVLGRGFERMREMERGGVGTAIDHHRRHLQRRALRLLHARMPGNEPVVPGWYIVQ